jgi:hypothetical protein
VLVVAVVSGPGSAAVVGGALLGAVVDGAVATSLSPSQPTSSSAARPADSTSGEAEPRRERTSR